MSDELDEIVDNITERSFWVRILFMIAFAIAAYIILLPLILVLSIAQALFTLITGQSNANLRYFSATLALYVPQVIEFLTYLSDAKPYPFSDLPEVEDDSLQEEPAAKSKTKTKEKQASEKENADSSAEATAEKKTPARKTAKKKAVKKKVAKKKAAKKSSASKSDAGSEDVSDS